MQTTVICRILPIEGWETAIQAERADVHPADFWRSGSIPLIADVRSLQRYAATTPVGEIKVAVITAADQWTPVVANALLKLLEEPPTHLRITLYSETAGLLSTISSRVRLDGAASGGSGPWTSLLNCLRPIVPGNAMLAERLLYMQAATHSGHDAAKIVRYLLPR